MSEWIMHIEAKRGWFGKPSTTLCGLTITKVEATGWSSGPSCKACKQLKKAGHK